MTSRKTVAHTRDGVGIDELTLSSASAEVRLLTIGAATRDWRVSHGGKETSVVLGYPSAADYVASPVYFGAIAGRVANRIAGGRFTLEGQGYQCSQNEGNNMLHGGHIGLAKRQFSADFDSTNNSALFTYHSPDGEEGFPASVDFSYKITLSGSTLVYELSATSDRPTPINLAQHNYYNLMGQGDARGHVLHVDAAQFTPTDDELIPVGKLESVEATPYDFRSPISMLDADPKEEGIDMNLALIPSEQRVINLVAPNGLQLSMTTDQDGLQVYSGAYLPKQLGQNGQKIGAFSGICLEPQQFPNAINQDGFNVFVASPNQPYYQKLSVNISGLSK